MLFIGRTMNKETQTGQRREREEKKGAIRGVAHITRGISRSSQNRLSVNVRASEFPHLSHPPLLLFSPPNLPRTDCALALRVQSCRKKRLLSR